MIDDLDEDNGYRIEEYADFYSDYYANDETIFKVFNYHGYVGPTGKKEINLWEFIEGTLEFNYEREMLVEIKHDGNILIEVNEIFIP